MALLLYCDNIKDVNKIECNVQFCHGGGLAMLGTLSISLSAEFCAIWKSDVVVES